MSLGPLYVFLGKMSVQVFCPFLHWVVCFSGVESCEFFIYFGDQSLVWGIICKCVFPYSWFCIHFNAVSLAMHKFFILMRSHLFILSSMVLALVNISVKILLGGISEIFLPMFSCRTFMVSWLIFKYFTPWVYFCIWCKLVFEFHFFPCSCPALPIPLVEVAIFAPFYAAAPFVKY